MPPLSVTSRIVLVGVCGASLAGWLGVRVAADPGAPLAAASIMPAPAVTALSASLAPAVPGAAEPAAALIPSTVSIASNSANSAGGATTGASAGTASDVAGGSQPGVRDRSAWQPSPVPAQSKLSAAPAASAPSAAQPQTQAIAQAPSPAATQAQAQTSAVRNRAAWQPSPVPAKSSSAGAPTSVTAATAPVVAATANIQSVSTAASGPTNASAANSGSAGGLPSVADLPAAAQVAPAADTAQDAPAAPASSSLPNLPSLTQAPPAAAAGLPGVAPAAPVVPMAPMAPVVVAPAPAIPPAVAVPAAPAPADTTANSTASSTASTAAPAAAKSEPAASAPDAPAADLAPAPVPYTPMSSMFTTDKLEAKFNGTLPAKRGTWVEQHFYSQALGRDDSYLVWLPPDYDATAQRYPSLYLLHGVGGPSGYGVEEWLGYALTEDLDRMLALGMIEPMIVVLPNGEQGYWMNHSPDTDGTRWADFVALDLVKDVDAHFRTDPRREHRGIGGLSMGGHGALQIALNHPDLFSVVGAHSPTIRPFETSPDFFGDPKWFAKYDPISLAKNTDAASKLAIWIDVGNNDELWLPMAEQLDQVLAAKKAAVQFHVLEGEHEGWYWEYYLPEYLNFYSSALNATAKTPKGAPVVDSRSILASSVVVTQANT